MQNTFGIYKTLYSLPQEFIASRPNETEEAYIARILNGWSDIAQHNFVSTFGFNPNCFVCSQDILDSLSSAVPYWIRTDRSSGKAFWNGAFVHLIPKNVLFWYCNIDNMFEVEDLLIDLDVDMLEQAKTLFHDTMSLSDA